MLTITSAKPRLLLDGDAILYRAAAACEREVRWDDQNHVLSSNALEAFGATKHIINKAESDTGGETFAIALSGPKPFRYELHPGYKAGRGRKPLCYARLVEMLKDAYRVRSVECLEADDLMGIWQTRGDLGNTIIVSEDKDMLTIPGKVWRKGQIVEVSENDANYNWLTQTLTGDSTDGYQGCPGIGGKKSETLLFGVASPWGTFDEAWNVVVETFVKKGLTEEDAILQARLARILRSSDWDDKKKEVKLWKPPSK